VQGDNQFDLENIHFDLGTSRDQINTEIDGRVPSWHIDNNNVGTIGEEDRLVLEANDYVGFFISDINRNNQFKLRYEPESACDLESMDADDEVCVEVYKNESKKGELLSFIKLPVKSIREFTLEICSDNPYNTNTIDNDDYNDYLDALENNDTYIYIWYKYSSYYVNNDYYFYTNEYFDEANNYEEGQTEVYINNKTSLDFKGNNFTLYQANKSPYYYKVVLLRNKENVESGCSDLDKYYLERRSVMPKKGVNPE
jgi:hypothetical protein